MRINTKIPITEDLWGNRKGDWNNEALTFFPRIKCSFCNSCDLCLKGSFKQVGKAFLFGIIFNSVLILQ